MDLQMPGDLAASYKSASQQARVVTEAWAQTELFCANCSSPRLESCANNTEASDLRCPKCEAGFQLKAKQGAIGASIGDGAYRAMLAAIREDRTPNLVVMRYAMHEWRVRDILLIPHFAFPESAIVCRKPLSATARRAGWVGCNIALHRIAPEAKIAIVTSGQSVTPGVVRAMFARLRPLSTIKASQRGWTLDVLNLVRSLGQQEFTNEDAYGFERRLEALHPDNRHIRPKIRQQLQVLRDAGLLIHEGPGRWRIS